MLKTPRLPALILALTGAVAAQTTCQAPAARQFPDEGGDHVAECSALSPSHYPPTSGPHFPVWANPGTYHFVVNSGYWLHAAEHGSVIFLINCRLTPDCAGDFVRFQAIADAFPADPACGAQDKHRIVISADTTITTRYAAAAWNWSLGSDCFDSAAFAGFLESHYAHPPTPNENFCGGGTNFPGTGWCNGPMSLAAPRAPARKAARSWRAALWPGLPESVRPDGRTLKP